MIEPPILDFLGGWRDFLEGQKPRLASEDVDGVLRLVLAQAIESVPRSRGAMSNAWELGWEATVRTNDPWRY